MLIWMLLSNDNGTEMYTLHKNTVVSGDNKRIKDDSNNLD